MKEQFGKPLNLKGLEDGNLEKHSLQKIVTSENNVFGNFHKNGKTEDMLKKSVQTKKDNGYYQSSVHKNVSSVGGIKGGVSRSLLPDFKEHIKKAVNNSIEARALIRHQKYTAILDIIKKEEFTDEDINNALKELNYEKGVNVRFMIKNNYIEICYEGTKRLKSDPKRYKKKPLENI